MPDHTAEFIKHLEWTAGVPVLDIRGILPKHPIKKYRRRELSDIKGMCLHHTAGEVYGEAGAVSAANYHIKSMGWPGIGYWAEIAPDGTVYVCNDLEAASYAQGYRGLPGDENAAYVAVALQGLFRSFGYENGNEPTARQMHSALGVWIALAEFFDLAPGELHGHFEFGKPACPGDTMKAIVEAVQWRGDSGRAPRAHVRLKEWRERQLVLKELGFDPGPIDGQPGPKTRAAIEAFQADRGLTVDGDWGPKTQAAMKSELDRH